MGKGSIRKVKKSRNKRHSRRIINFKAYLEIAKDSNLMKHAIDELKLAGYYKDNNDGPNKWMREQILELLAVFTSHGHSGSSAPWAISLFTKLANWETISPLTLEDDEFGEAFSLDGTKQNKRNSRIFKDDKGISFIDAFVKQSTFVKRFGTNEVVKSNGHCWSGTVLESDNNIATGRAFRTCYFTKKDIEAKRLPIGNTIKLKCTEIEVQPENWLMFVDFNESNYAELRSLYDIEYKDVPNIKGKNILELTEDYGY